MLTLAGGCRLLTHQQLQPRLALLLLALSLAASLPVLQGSSEVFKYGDDPEFAGNDTGTHWTYGLAGEDWAGSEPDGSTWLCQSGQQQSPVNLPTSPDAAAPLDASHKASWQLGSLTANGSNVGIANNGHNVQVSWQDPSFEPYLSLVVQAGQPLESCLTLRPGHKTATVKAVPQQLHFHTHSEHLLGGRIFPLEAHLVSLVEQSQLPSCPPGGCVVVTAVLFELGDNLTQDNAWLAPLFEAMPYSEGEASHLPAGTRFDLQQLLPPNSSYIAYGGSLTTPPCSEGVTWLVMLEPQPLSLKQWRDFMKAVGDYNCTLNGSTSDAGSINGTAPAPRVGLAEAPSNSSSSSGSSSQGAPAANITGGNNISSNSSAVASSPPNRLLLSTNRDTAIISSSSVHVPSTGLSRLLLEAASSGQHYSCSKLGAGSNYRLPQPLNGRTLRIWRDVSSSKKSYLNDAASAASAGAVAGIVIGVTLGAGLTAGFGYWGWKLYNKRRLKRFYNMDNDMMMVTQEVERQWLNTGPGGSSAPVAGAGAAGLARSRHSINNIP
uniref:Carbonic anhydrase n=1 Tax=Tetradesmus obliquus TaxID=3088 RepID=A0A383VPS2_TETOB|eukprot:jgi/Sobl393_1/6146/SZX67528.1